ncbi:M15 family metallopeptidase [Agromyces ramosus]|uniref:D-alanyl-D-alanine carboxypeptidase n=1 Tax=Agromyces ramosus TaxID=33879 RepID=A0ABU0RD19_9MICO|nr:M15 family metallopeptidase [Agromyces ramosus]MDQ0895969.1 D-alanyl-D-alanine carboxypeptidase [Agromyces ramosus]
MSRTATARTRPRRRLGLFALGLVVVATAVTGTVVSQLSEPASSSAHSFSEVPPGDPGTTIAADDGAISEHDGILPGGVSVFDDDYPAVANLDPDLLHAVRAAAMAAADDGVEFTVNSGWRSAEYQDQLLREAVSDYGSEEEAARWVATADTSAHVSGKAVDIGSYDATAWLSEHGAGYGLCQIYGNESWHYELRPEAIDRGCPPMFADPTQDPRMQQ